MQLLSDLIRYTIHKIDVKRQKTQNMKKLIVLIIAALITMPAFTQIKWGIKAGLSTTSVTMANAKTLTTSSANYTVDALKEANYGFHAGLFVRLTILGIYLQPEVVFASTESRYNVTNVTAGTAALPKSQKFNKLDIPVLLGVKVGPIRLNAGPAASLLINSPKALIDDTALKTRFSAMSFGYQAGVGLDILKTLTVDLRYEGSLKKYQSQIQNTTGTITVNLDDRPNAFLLSVGLMF
jgi:opacity protein-like surface antigen